MAKRKKGETGYISDFHKLPELDNYKYKGDKEILIKKEIPIKEIHFNHNSENEFYDFLLKNGEIKTLGEIKVIFLLGKYYYYNQENKIIKTFTDETEAFNYALSLYKL